MSNLRCFLLVCLKQGFLTNLSSTVPHKSILPLFCYCCKSFFFNSQLAVFTPQNRHNRETREKKEYQLFNICYCTSIKFTVCGWIQSVALIKASGSVTKHCTNPHKGYCTVIRKSWETLLFKMWEKAPFFGSSSGCDFKQTDVSTPTCTRTNTSAGRKGLISAIWLRLTRMAWETEMPGKNKAEETKFEKPPTLAWLSCAHTHTHTHVAGE